MPDPSTSSTQGPILRDFAEDQPPAPEPARLTPPRSHRQTRGSSHALATLPLWSVHSKGFHPLPYRCAIPLPQPATALPSQDLIPCAVAAASEPVVPRETSRPA